MIASKPPDPDAAASSADSVRLRPSLRPRSIRSSTTRREVRRRHAFHLSPAGPARPSIVDIRRVCTRQATATTTRL
jgi:hypothetical protein